MGIETTRYVKVITGGQRVSAVSSKFFTQFASHKFGKIENSDNVFVIYEWLKIQLFGLKFSRCIDKLRWRTKVFTYYDIL